LVYHLGATMLQSGSAKKSTDERAIKYWDVVEEDPINMELLRVFAFHGIPDMEGLRSIYWKLLLGYLPPTKRDWPQTLKQSRELYEAWKEELILDPAKLTKKADHDHPLNIEETSSWNRFFKDSELEVEVEKDVRRTFPHYHFFNGEAERERHGEAVKRILFIYAKLNPGIGYVQGMNEILGPLYYIMVTDSSPEWQEFVEPDVFFCFTNLMSEIRDNFCKTLDKSEMGVQGSMSRLNELLKRKNPVLWQNLEDKQLDPQFYSFRWLTLLLSQEFELPDICRLWDSFFSDPKRFEFMTYFCCAMLLAVSGDLLRGSFADNLKLLQHYPTTIDIGALIKLAMELRNSDLDQQPLESKPETVKQTQRSSSSPVFAQLRSRSISLKAYGASPSATDDTSQWSGIMGGMTRTWSLLTSSRLHSEKREKESLSSVRLL